MIATRSTQNGRTKDKNYIRHESNFRLAFLSFIVMSPALTYGMVSPFSGVALPQMNLTLDEASWFGSIVTISSFFGSLGSGLIIDKYGRRMCMITSIIPNSVGWFLLAETSASLIQLYIGRLLTGFGIGSGLLPSVVYAAECIFVNNLQIRGIVGTCLALSMVAGGLLLYVFSIFLPYQQVVFAVGCLSALSLLMILIFIPESPAWLYKRGRVGDAEIAQLRLRIRQPILRNPETSLHTAESSNFWLEQQAYSLESLIRYLSQVERPNVYKPLVISIFLKFFSEFSGVYGLLSYMIDVITVQPLALSPNVLSVIGQVIQGFGCILLSFLLPHCGVKILCFVSFLGASIGFIALAISILFEDASRPKIFNYLHVASVWTVMFAGQLGIFSIPYTILGEMFPMGAKGFASITLSMDCVFNFVLLKLFPYLLAMYRTSMFFVCSVICACGAIFVAYYLPETVGKTPDEISRGFDARETY